MLVGGFVQDSWNVLDRVTVNAGIRYDSQTLHGTNGRGGLAFPNEWSPRLGVVWDFTQQGRAKLYGNYARYYENVPLDIADRSFGRESLALGVFGIAKGDCSPRSPTTATCAPRAQLTPGVGLPPSPHWRGVTGVLPFPVDPAIGPPTVDEWVAGIEYEVFPNTRASLAYNHRHIVRWVEDMSTTGGVSYFIGNPGERSAASFPLPKRIYNSASVAVNRAFADLWLAQVSYTYQHLMGNLQGLFAQSGQLDPNLNADFDIQRLLVNRFGPLPADVSHTIKAYLSKEFVILPVLSVTAGLAYVGTSGTPIDFLGVDALTGYGAGQVFVFPRGSGGRLPWHHTVDVNAALNYRISAATLVTLSVNAFNLFNFQQVTAVSPNYTVNPDAGVSPVPNGNPATDRSKIVNDVSRQPLDPALINPNFWRPVQYQPVRQIRFQARVTF